MTGHCPVRMTIHGADPVGERTLEALGEAAQYSEWQLSTVKAYVGRRVLEIGAGLGNTSAQLIALDPEALFLTDQRDSYLARLEHRFGSRPEVEVRRLRLPIGNADEWRGAKLDTIVAFNVLEHVQHDVQAIQGLASVLQPGGHLLMLVPAHPRLMCPLDHELGHYRRYTLRSASTLLSSAGLVPVRTSYFNFPGALGWLWRGTVRRKRELSPEGVRLFERLVPALRVIDSLPVPFGLSVVVVGRR